MTSDWLEIKLKTQGSAKPITVFALPLVSWDLDWLNSSEALTMKTLLYRLLVELFSLLFTEIFLGELEWRLLIFLFKKNCQITCSSASDLLCDDTSALFLFACSGTSSCLHTWWKSSLQDRDCTFQTLCCRLGPAWWLSTRCQKNQYGTCHEGLSPKSFFTDCSWLYSNLVLN